MELINKSRIANLPLKIHSQINAMVDYKNSFSPIMSWKEVADVIFATTPASNSLYATETS